MKEFLELSSEEGPKVNYSNPDGPYKEYPTYTWPMYYQGLPLPNEPKQTVGSQSQCRGSFDKKIRKPEIDEDEENPWDILAEYYEALN